MPLAFRPANPSEYPKIETMVIESFEPISWIKRLEDRMGPLNGRDWRTRFKDRMRHVFATEIVLVGETGGEIVSFRQACVTRDRLCAQS